MMRDVLRSDTEYAYLDPTSLARLKEARKLANTYHLCDKLVFEQDDMQYILPWIGTLEMETLYREIRFCLNPQCKIEFGRSGDYYLAVCSPLSAESLKSKLYELRKNHCDPYTLVYQSEELYNGKYSYFVPRELRVEEFVEDFVRQDFEYL